MSTIEAQPVVGLFGTCGDSTFRKDLFIPEYERLGIAYFNPQVDDWKPEYADVEADHLATDTVQCWPVASRMRAMIWPKRPNPAIKTAAFCGSEISSIGVVEHWA